MARVQERKDFDPPVRLRLIEADLDELEGDLKAGMSDLRGELAKIKGVLLGILISVTTASVLLAINLVVSRA